MNMLLTHLIRFTKVLTISILISIFPQSLSAQDTLALQGPDYFLEGVKHFNNEEWELARKLLEETLVLEPQHDAAWYYLGRLHAHRSEMIEAEHYLTRAYQADSTNYWYAVELAKFYANTFQTDRAAGLYEELLEKHPSKSTLYSDLLSLYSNAQQYDKALATLDRLDQLRGENEWTGNFRFELLRMQGRYEEAFALLEKLEATYPNPQNSYLMGEVYHSQRKDSTAIVFYEKALRLDPRYTPAQFGLAEAFRTTGDFAKFFHHIGNFMGDEQMNSSFKIDYIRQVLGNLAIQSRHQASVDTLIRKVINTHPTDTSLRYTVGNYFLQTGRTKEGTDHYFKIVEMHPEDLNPNLQYLYLLYYLQQWNDLEAQCKMSLGYLPQNRDIRQLQAIANTQLLRYDQAIDQYKALLKDIPRSQENERLMCYSALGDLYQQNGQPKKAYKEYDKALKINPNYLPVLNNYSYFLSLEGKRLDKAYEMSLICIQTEPDNPTYLDTHGWVLYQLGRYKEAIAQFKRAMLYGGNESAVILDHYADALFATGERALADIYWEQADRLDPSLGIAYKIKKNQNR